MKLKLLHAIGSLSKGGAEFQCRQLANHLDPKHYDVSILCFDEGPNPDLAPHVRPLFVDRGSKWDIVGLYRRVAQVVEDQKPDILQAWLPEVVSVPAALAASQMGIPVICGHRNTLGYEGDLTKAVRDCLRLPQYLVADRIVSNFHTDEEPRAFRWLYQRKKGECVFNGIDVNALSGIAPQPLPVRSEHRLIYAGRLAGQKGIPLALRALDLLLRKGLDVHLTLFGEGPEFYEAELRRLVATLDLEQRVTFFGQCRDWQAYAADADALIFPTRGEGTSNVILEALSVGLPVVISDIAMSRRLLDDERTALIVQSRYPEDWSYRISGLLNSPELQEKLRAAGRQLSDRFSVESMVAKYEHLYAGLVA